MLLKPGQQATSASTRSASTAEGHDDGQKQMVDGDVTVFVDGKEIDHMYAGEVVLPQAREEPTTEVAIRRAPGEDLYIVLGGYDLADAVGDLKPCVNPLVNWIWFGFGLLALGTGIALLPERAFALRDATACQAGVVTSG